jgi:preprotein translocase subunit SecD
MLKLGSQIVGQPLKIVMGGQTICEPIVREPLGRRGRIWISVFGLGEARALAERLREHWSKVNFRLIPHKTT